MSWIVLVSKETAPSASFLMDVKRASGASPGDLKSALAAGEPFFKTLLWMNTHVEDAARLRAVLAASDAHNVRVEIHEVLHDETFEKSDPAITLTTRAQLDEMLARNDEEFE